MDDNKNQQNNGANASVSDKSKTDNEVKFDSDKQLSNDTENKSESVEMSKADEEKVKEVNDGTVDGTESVSVCVQEVDKSVDEHVVTVVTVTNEVSENDVDINSNKDSYIDEIDEIKDHDNQSEPGDSENEFKRRPSPLYHNDSGLGTSLNSPVGSSTEASPQHICQTVTCIEDGNPTMNIETLTLCSEINSAWSAKVDAGSNLEANTNNNAEYVKGDMDNSNGATETILSNNGASKQQVENNEKCDETFTENNEENKDDDTEKVVENGNSKDKGEHEMRDQTRRTNQKVKNSLTLTVNKGSSSEARKYSSESRESQSPRSSSHSISPGVSNMNSYAEVFSHDASSDLTSFQQYYINKRNLDGGAAKALESQVKKSQMPKKMFNPFPVKHVNQNRAKTGIKLGLYKPATLEEFERNLKGNVVWGK